MTNAAQFMEVYIRRYLVRNEKGFFQIPQKAINPFMNNVVKWFNVHTARFLKYVWPIYNIMHERVNPFRPILSLYTPWKHECFRWLQKGDIDLKGLKSVFIHECFHTWQKTL